MGLLKQADGPVSIFFFQDDDDGAQFDFRKTPDAILIAEHAFRVQVEGTKFQVGLVCNAGKRADKAACHGGDAENETKEDAQRLDGQLQGTEHEVVIGEGKLWDVMSDLIEKKEIDLVILGTRGRTGLGKALLGSAAEQILRQSPCPVLTVGPHVNPWSDEYAKMNEILYATDLAIDNPIAAPYAISLAQENQAHLVLLHVVEDPKAGDLVDSPELIEVKERKLQQMVTEQAGLWCNPTYIVEQGPAAEKILDVAKRRDTDLIVLGARPAKGLATHLSVGTVHKVVSQATCPVLTVRG